MLTLSDFLQNLWVRLVVSGLLVFFAFGIMYYNLSISACQAQIRDLRNTNDRLSRELTQLESSDSYLTSDSYRDKELKLNNYKNKGEIVIDTSIAEPIPSNPDQNYIPEIKAHEESPFEKWIELFKNPGRTEFVSCGTQI